jgi:hypothetical protein
MPERRAGLLVQRPDSHEKATGMPLRFARIACVFADSVRPR